MLSKINFAHFFIINDFVWLAAGQHGAVADDVGAVANTECFAHIVIGDQHANAAILQKCDDFLNVHDRNRVDTGERFVEQDKARISCQSARDFDTPAFATGQADGSILAQGLNIQIAQKIIDGEGDYCLALKANRPVLHADVERFFADPDAATVAMHTTTDGDHGRIEERRHVVCHDIDWLFSDRRYTDEPAFPGVAMIGMVESKVERDGKLARERRYYICLARLDAPTFARAVRAHWGVENRLHWVLDVVIHDGLARLQAV